MIKVHQITAVGPPVVASTVWLNPDFIVEVYVSVGNPTGAYLIMTTTVPANMEVTETVTQVVQAIQANNRAG